MKKSKIKVDKAYRLINYGPVVLVTSAWKDKQNIATIAWCTPLSSEPVLIGIAVYKNHLTRKLISKGKEFAINIPSAELVEKVVNCGSVHGFQVDKFKKFKLTPFSSSIIKPPLIAECFAHLECKLEKEVKVGDHFLFVGKVVGAWADEKTVRADGIVDIKKVKTLHHLGGDKFGSLVNIRSLS